MRRCRLAGDAASTLTDNCEGARRVERTRSGGAAVTFETMGAFRAGALALSLGVGGKCHGVRLLGERRRGRACGGRCGRRRGRRHERWLEGDRGHGGGRATCDPSRDLRGLQRLGLRIRWRGLHERVLHDTVRLRPLSFELQWLPSRPWVFGGDGLQGGVRARAARCRELHWRLRALPNRSRL